MPSIPLHPPSHHPSPTTLNPLPPLLHTPTGLALLEIQGTIHFPAPSATASATRVGKLVFPLYNPALNGEGDAKWMKRVYLYVGENQRMVGECRKLGKALAVVRRKDGDGLLAGKGNVRMGGAEEARDELEIVEVVRHKLVFSGRPEPVGGGTEER